MSGTDSDCKIDTSEINIKLEGTELISIYIKTEDIDRISTTDNSYIDENKDLSKVSSKVKTESSSIKYDCELAEKINVNDFGHNSNDSPNIKQELDSTDFEVNKELLHSVCDLPKLKREDIGFPDGNLQQRRKKHKLGNKYQCSFCIISFPSVDQRFKHQCVKFSEVCFYCGEYFYQRIQFLMHFFRHHFIKETKNSGKQRNILYRKKDMKHLQYNICAKKFQIQRHLKQLPLDKRKNMFKCKICLKIFKFNNGLGTTQSKPVLCKTCSKPFDKTNLSAKNTPNCKICFKVFSTKISLKLHMKTHTLKDIEEKPFKCDICSRAFKLKKYLKKHMVVHNEEIPYNCEICSQNFRYKRSLKQHMLRHTGEKPFKCELCSQAFRDKSTLKQHLLIHTGEKPFVCEICSHTFQNKQQYSFRTRSALKFHMVKHTGIKPFKCEICSHTCGLKTNLKKHMLKHTGEKAFQCEICSSSFGLKTTLKQHMVVHTGEKPFKCNICSYTFSVKSNLNRHMMTHS